ncbi:MAG: trypsin-like peptidase domain-containing protein [Candidatus Babeliales bacterium]
MFKFNKKILIFIFFAFNFCKHINANINGLENINSDTTCDWSAIQKKYKNAVVQIFADVAFFNWSNPAAECKYESRLFGSGFLIKFNDQFYIITNFHVIGSGEKCILNVQLPCVGKERFEVEIVGCHADKDIAILRLTEESLKNLKSYFKDAFGSEELPYLNLGESIKCASGTSVAGMGFPLGQENFKISPGEVSGHQSIENHYYIQTTLPVNSGNSGGPVVDCNGNVVGIIQSNIPNAQNIGYFIPINLVKNIIYGFINNEFKNKVLRDPFWGCSFCNTTKDTLNYLGNPDDGGVYVEKVLKNSVFEKSGICQGDVLYQVNNTRIDKYGYVNVDWCEDKISLYELLNSFNIGFCLVIYRNGKRLERDIEIKEEDRFVIDKEYPQFKEPDYINVGGMVLMELRLNYLMLLKSVIKVLVKKYNIFMLYDILKYSNAKNLNKSKVVIAHLNSGSAIEKLRSFELADILEKLNGVSINTLQDVKYALSLAKDSGYLAIETKSGSFAVVKMTDIKIEYSKNLDKIE